MKMFNEILISNNYKNKKKKYFKNTKIMYHHKEANRKRFRKRKCQVIQV